MGVYIMVIHYFPLFDDTGGRLDVARGNIQMKELELESRSGNKRWLDKIVSLEDFSKHTDRVLNDIVGDVNRAALLELRLGINRAINFLAPLIPVETGQLKSGFVSAFKIDTYVDADDKAIVKMEFDFQQWLTQVPYARYHIEELSGKSQYKNAIGKPVDMDILILHLKTAVKLVFDHLTSSGYHVIQDDAIDRIGEELDDDDYYDDDYGDDY